MKIRFSLQNFITIYLINIATFAILTYIGIPTWIIIVLQVILPLVFLPESMLPFYVEKDNSKKDNIP